MASTAGGRYGDQGGGHRSHGMGQLKRPHPGGGGTRDDMAALRTQMVFVADRAVQRDGEPPPPPPAEALERLAQAVVADLGRFHDNILDVLFRCILELPGKTPVYAALVGILNATRADFAAAVVERVHAAMQQALDEHRPRDLKVLLRFVACLAACRVVSTSALGESASALLASATAALERPDRNVWQLRADAYAFAVMAALPWAAGFFHASAPAELETLLGDLAAYMAARSPLRTEGARLIRREDDEDEDEVEVAARGLDSLRDLWQRLDDLRTAGQWAVENVAPVAPLMGQARHGSGPLHDLGCVSPPPLPAGSQGDAEACHMAEAKAYPPRVPFRLFPASRSEKDMAPIERFVAEDVILDTMHHFCGNHKEAALRMLAPPMPKTNDYIVMEAVMGEMLRLPASPQRAAYYTVLVADFCKMKRTEFPPVLARTVQTLFHKLPRLDVETARTLSLWLSHHLSNFGFIWPWSEWREVVTLPPWAAKRLFCASVIDRLTRLSYHSKVAKTLPPEFLPLMPPEPKPRFKYSTEASAGGASEQAAAAPAAAANGAGSRKDDVSGAIRYPTEAALSAELTTLIRSKQTARDLLMWVEDKVMPVGGENAPLFALEVVAQTLLHIGSKSYTHLVTVLERFHPLLSALAADSEKQLFLLDVVADFWQDSSQWTALAIERMMTTRLVANTVIATWAFQPRQVVQMHTSDKVWEVLRTAINKTVLRTNDLRAEVEALRARAAAEGGAGEDGDANMRDSTAAAEAAEEAVIAKEALLMRALKEQESLFLVFFERFATCISEQLVALEAAAAGGADEEMEADPTTAARPKLKRSDLPPWVAMALGQLRSFARFYHDELQPLLPRLRDQVLAGILAHEDVREAALAGLLVYHYF